MLTSVLNLWEATVWLLKQRFDGIGNEILNTCPLSPICDAHALPAVTSLPLPDTVICFGYAITRVTKDSYIFVVTNIDSSLIFETQPPLFKLLLTSATWRYQRPCITKLADILVLYVRPVFLYHTSLRSPVNPINESVVDQLL